MDARDKLDYLLIMGKECTFEDIKGWVEDDFYEVYLNENYINVPIVVLTATIQVVMANNNLRDRGLSTESFKIKRINVTTDEMSESQSYQEAKVNVTTRLDLSATMGDYFKKFAKYTLAEQEEEHYQLYYRDNMLSYHKKLRVETAGIIMYLGRYKSTSEIGDNFKRTYTHDIIEYLMGRVKKRETLDTSYRKIGYNVHWWEFLQTYYTKDA